MEAPSHGTVADFNKIYALMMAYILSYVSATGEYPTTRRHQPTLTKRNHEIRSVKGFKDRTTTIKRSTL